MFDRLVLVSFLALALNPQANAQSTKDEKIEAFREQFRQDHVDQMIDRLPWYRPERIGFRLIRTFDTLMGTELSYVKPPIKPVPPRSKQPRYAHPHHLEAAQAKLSFDEDTKTLTLSLKSDVASSGETCVEKYWKITQTPSASEVTEIGVTLERKDPKKEIPKYDERCARLYNPACKIQREPYFALEGIENNPPKCKEVRLVAPAMSSDRVATRYYLLGAEKNQVVALGDPVSSRFAKTVAETHCEDCARGGATKIEAILAQTGVDLESPTIEGLEAALDRLIQEEQDRP